MKYEPIAIIGMGCRFPGGANNPELFWELIAQGKDVITEIPSNRWNVDNFYDPDPQAKGKSITKNGGFLNYNPAFFDAEYFKISPREAELMDPQQRLLLEVIVEGLENAGLASSSLSESETGVFIGIYSHDMADLLNQDLAATAGIYNISGTGNSVATGRISYIFNLRGPNFPIDTACSSSLVALDAACHYLHEKEINLAIVGGVNLLLSPNNFINMSKASMLSPDGRCKTFDISANGYGRGEGCGIVILRRLEDAIQNKDNILAVIKGTGVNHDGASNGLTAPNGKSQEDLMFKVCQKANLDFDDIDYLEAHGTGTSLGDPIEVRAIGKTYGKRNKDHPLFIGTVKTNIGHTESAAGVAGLIKTILMLKYKEIPATLHIHKINPEIELNFPFEFVTKKTPWDLREKKNLRHAAVSSFGFGGTNAHAIIEEYINEVLDEDDQSLQIFTLSAKNDTALNALIESYLIFLNQTSLSLADICFTVNTGRNQEKYRIAIVAKSLEDLKNQLNNHQFFKGEAKHFKLMEDTKDVMEIAKKYVEGGTINWQKFYISKRKKVPLPTYPFQRKSYWLEGVSTGASETPNNFIQDFQKNGNNELIVNEYITRIVRSILKYPPDKEMDEKQGFFEMGMDSLMAVELTKMIQKAFEGKVRIKDTLLFDYPTIAKVVAYLLKNIDK